MKTCNIIGGNVDGFNISIDATIHYLKKLRELESKEEELKKEGKRINYGHECYRDRSMLFVRIDDKDYYVEVLFVCSIGIPPFYHVIIRDCVTFKKVTGRLTLDDRKGMDVNADNVKEQILQKIVDRVEKGKWIEWKKGSNYTAFSFYPR